MFPLEEGCFAPKNRWYVAAWSDEVTRTPMERWLLDEPVALYRKEDGTPVALDGRCPHHLYPLGKSALSGDNVVCGYHGLQFRPDGGCAGAPFLDRVPSACRVKSYPLCERWQWIWIWPGDPALADESLIPDHAAIGLTDPSYHAARGLHLEIDARYQLINDNLLDLQHLEVLHAGMLGDDGIGRVTEHREIGEDWISSVRQLDNIDLPGVFQAFFGKRKVDRSLTMTWYVPGLHVGPDTFTLAQGEDGAGEELMKVIAFHAITPARRGSCHYFVTFARSFRLGDDALTAKMLASFGKVLEQDSFAAEEIEKQVRGMNRPHKEMLFKSDKTLAAGRKILETMIKKETAQSSS